MASSRILCVTYFIIHFDFVYLKTKYNTLPLDIRRSTVYKPYVIDKTCLLTPDTGPCRGAIPMFYYEASSGNCSVFSWGGCQGNGNRFDTLSDCVSSCISKPDPPNERPQWCQLSFDYGFCFGAFQRWYYDPLWKVCKERIYSGCGGNKNNFHNKEQCDELCRFGKPLHHTEVTPKVSKFINMNPAKTPKH